LTMFWAIKTTRKMLTWSFIPWCRSRDVWHQQKVLLICFWLVITWSKLRDWWFEARNLRSCLPFSSNLEEGWSTLLFTSEYYTMGK
jgi:hypothetical protein